MVVFKEALIVATARGVYFYNEKVGVLQPIPFSDSGKAGTDGEAA